MLKHIVLFQLADSLPSSELKQIKTLLEALPDKIEGLNSLKVYINNVGEDNFSMALDSTMDCASALDIYQKHPEHLKCVQLLKPHITNRACVDSVEK